jgi:hypothetical protein
MMADKRPRDGKSTCARGRGGGGGLVLTVGVVGGQETRVLGVGLTPEREVLVVAGAVVSAVAGLGAGRTHVLAAVCRECRGVLGGRLLERRIAVHEKLRRIRGRDVSLKGPSPVAPLASAFHGRRKMNFSQGRILRLALASTSAYSPK